MKSNRRAIVIVLDSVGIGELPDAKEYGDEGSHTLRHIAEAVGGLKLENLEKMGLGKIDSLPGLQDIDAPVASYGKMAEMSKGKDTTTGHWELAGIITEKPFPTYPNGFPADVLSQFENAVGRRAMGNVVASGTEIIKMLGDEHVHTGRPIVYTSADSVFQIAAHEDVVPVDELYNMCKKAREILSGENNVQRVIARPFNGSSGNYKRTERRRDFTIEPPEDTILDIVHREDGEVVAIGKTEDIFAGRSISRSVHSTNNKDGVAATIEEIKSGAGSLIFTNLVDFDMLWGHRNDPQGYAESLAEFDKSLPDILEAIGDEDILIITADHGCDPTTISTDHSREYVPLIAYVKNQTQGVALGTRETFADVACTVAEHLELGCDFPGSSFMQEMTTSSL